MDSRLPENMPPAPVNVRLVLDDGEEVAVECVYLYKDAEGVHLWEVIMPDRAHGHLSGLKAEALPGKTSVAVPMPPRSV